MYVILSVVCIFDEEDFGTENGPAAAIYPNIQRSLAHDHFDAYVHRSSARGVCTGTSQGVNNYSQLGA